MEKKAGFAFIKSSVLWFVVCCIGVGMFIGVFNYVFLVGLAESKPILCALLIFAAESAATFLTLYCMMTGATDAVKRKFPDMESTDRLKATAKKFYIVLAVIGIAFLANAVRHIPELLEMGKNINQYTVALWAAALMVVFSAFMNTALPLLMIKPCIKRIDKLYPQNIAEQEEGISDGEES